MESTASKLNKYRNAINFDDFVDYLISQKIIDEKEYLRVWNKDKRDRVNELLKIISNGESQTTENLLGYLKGAYPNAERVAENEDRRRTISVRGGVPRLPPNYVSRKDLVERLKRELYDLTWEKKIVIHGMMGYGKSCLINEVIRDPDVSKHFDNYVFWINLGDCHSVDYVWQHMSRLYTAANSVIENKISQCHEDIKLLRDLLSNLFAKSNLKSSLLILDDACNEEVLSYFDFKCKTVITTQNRNVLRNEDATFIEVKLGFSMNESMELFKKSLDLKGDLPTSAEEIHYACQGHPMIIALIGSYLGDNVAMVKGKDDDIWLYIKENVVRGNYRLNEYNNHLDIPIHKCIEKLLLNKDLKDKYYDLAIFEQDVNIPPAVLQILWNKSKIDVRNIMTILADKSLVVPFYHEDLQTYIYGIHELLLTYLKKQTVQITKELHRKLIDGFDRVTGGNYANLPNDNYTLQFIGHHLLKAEAFEKFNIYFDFKFLEAKIRAAGKEDLLRDMDKYRTYITKQDNKLEEKLDQYKRFINRCGCNLYSYKKTDILQYALRESKDTVVFEDALKLAKSSNQLYFQLQKTVDEPDYSQTMKIKDDITCACFVDSSHHILVGNTEGRITLFYEQSPKEISNFVGHRAAIKTLVVNPSKSYFLSIDVAGYVNLYKFSAESARNSRDFSNQILAPPVSPKTKQSYWQDMHTPDKGQVTAKATFHAPENDDSLVSAGFCYEFPLTYNIVTGSKRGNVTVWDAREMVPICKTENRGIEVSSIMYQNRDRMDVIVFLCEDIITYEVRNNELAYLEKLYTQETCLSVYSFENTKVAVSEKSIFVWSGYSQSKVFTWEDDNKKNICSTITDDFQYLVVATNQRTVFVWDLFHKKMLHEFESKGLALSLDTIYDEEKCVYLLLIATDSHTLQLFPVQPFDDVDKPRIKGLPLAILWKRKNVLSVFEATEGCLQVFSGNVQISETEPLSIPTSSACLSPCGTFLLYGLENGEIRSFNLKSKKDMCIQSPDPSNTAVTHLGCYDPNNPYSQRFCSSPSASSTDSLNYEDCYSGLLIAVSKSHIVKIYKDGSLISTVNNIEHPVICYCPNRLIFVDRCCKVHAWSAHTGIEEWSNPNIIEEVRLTAAAFCPEKSLLAISYCQISPFLDLYALNDGKRPFNLNTRLELKKVLTSICYSTDGSLVAGGFDNGDISIWNLRGQLKTVSLKLHSSSIELLVFSPNLEPILVSLGEEIAYWNLKPFQKQPRIRGRPTGIDVLSDLTSDMDISFWTERKPVANEEYLLSCMKLQGKAKYVSASRNFNSFLTVDDRGNVYIMDVINGG